MATNEDIIRRLANIKGPGAVQQRLANIAGHPLGANPVTAGSGPISSAASAGRSVLNRAIPSPTLSAPNVSGIMRPISSLANKAASLAGKVAVPVALGATAAQTYATPTEQYAERFGMQPGTGGAGGLAKDVMIRGLGAASDLGNTMTLGAAGNLYRDKQNAPTATPSIIPEAGATPEVAPQAMPIPEGAPENPVVPPQDISTAPPKSTGYPTVSSLARPADTTTIVPGTTITRTIQNLAGGNEPGTVSGDRYTPGASYGGGQVEVLRGGLSPQQEILNMVDAANKNQNVQTESLLRDARIGAGTQKQAAAAQQAVLSQAAGQPTGAGIISSIMGAQEQGKAQEKTANIQAASGLERERMQQSGANARHDSSGAAINQMKLGWLKEYQDPNTSAERRAQLAPLVGVGGKSSPYDLSVVPSGTDEFGAKLPSQVVKINKQTGEVEIVQPSQLGGASAAGRSAPAAPKVGEMRDGYKFKGGNPADKANWEKI